MDLGKQAQMQQVNREIEIRQQREENARRNRGFFSFDQQRALNERIAYTHNQNPYTYIIGQMTRLPENVNVHGGNAAQPNPGMKERRRQKKVTERNLREYKNIGNEMRLIRPEEMTALTIFRNEKEKSAWANEKLSHSTKTRGEVVSEVRSGDYSSFENLDISMRNFLASQTLYEFMKEYEITEMCDPKEVCNRLKRINASNGGMQALLNPRLRLGLSLAQKTDGIPDGLKDFFRRLDEEMTTQVMVETLTCEGDMLKVKEDFVNRHGMDEAKAQEKAAAAVEANKAQQIQLAKRLLMMQLSNFQQVDTKVINGEKVSENIPWSHSMAVALSHCSRVVFTLPKVERSGGNSQENHDRMWKVINFGLDGNNTAQDNSRASSTHSIERRKVGSSRFGSKEKKVFFNLIGQRGMNIAIGGLGNAGVGGRTLNNDGSCGHIYSMHKTANTRNYGTMLMGIESDEAGVMNQMGHIHDIHATPEKASSFGGQRTDEIGDKYGGRQCDLSYMNAEKITHWLTMLELKMKEATADRQQTNDRRKLMEILAGEKMTAENLMWVRGYLGISNT